MLRDLVASEFGHDPYKDRYAPYRYQTASLIAPINTLNFRKRPLLCKVTQLDSGLAFETRLDFPADGVKYEEGEHTHE